MSVCTFVLNCKLCPSGFSLKLLVRECIANIGIPLEIPRFWQFRLFNNLKFSVLLNVNWKTFVKKPHDIFVPSQTFQHFRRILQNPKLKIMASFASTPINLYNS